jgi:hypothetical protein
MDHQENQVAGLSTEPAERALAALALGEGFELPQAMALVQEGASVVATMAAYQTSLAPLKALEGRAKADGARALDDALRPIGAKVAPHLSPDQCKAWRAAMVTALSDLTPRTAVKATREAVHVPMQFLSEAEGVIRDKASEVDARHAKALWRLRKLQAEIEAAAQPRLVAPEGWEGGKAGSLTEDELRRTPGFVLRWGLAAGHVTEAQLVEAGIAIPEPDPPSAATVAREAGNMLRTSVA